MTQALENRIPPPLVGLVLVGAMWLLAAAIPTLAVPLGWRWALSAPLLAAAVWFDLQGLLAFRRARTTVNPLRPQKASQLVTEGIYRRTRNPMYVGMALILTAVAVLLAAPAALAGPAAFIAYITRFQIVPEERALRRLFGDEFDEYCAHVPRWL